MLGVFYVAVIVLLMTNQNSGKTAKAICFGRKNVDDHLFNTIHDWNIDFLSSMDLDCMVKYRWLQGHGWLSRSLQSKSLLRIFGYLNFGWSCGKNMAILYLWKKK